MRGGGPRQEAAAEESLPWKRNKQLREAVKKVKRSLRRGGREKNGRHLELLNRKLSEKLAAAAGRAPASTRWAASPRVLPAGLTGMEHRPP